MQLSSLYKAPKGLLKIRADIEHGVIRDIMITGDFFMIPEESLPLLEGKLLGKRLERRDVEIAVEELYAMDVQTPGLSKEDLVRAILGVRDGS